MECLISVKGCKDKNRMDLQGQRWCLACCWTSVPECHVLWVKKKIQFFGFTVYVRTLPKLSPYCGGGVCLSQWSLRLSCPRLHAPDIGRSIAQKTPCEEQSKWSQDPLAKMQVTGSPPGARLGGRGAMTAPSHALTICRRGQRGQVQCVPSGRYLGGPTPGCRS